MKINIKIHYVFLATLILFLHQGCVPEKGPIFLNTTNSPVHLLAKYEDGHEIPGDLPAGTTLWAGYGGGEILSMKVEFQSGDARILQGSVLTDVLDSDKFVCFLITEDGFQKVTEQEMRSRWD